MVTPQGKSVEFYFPGSSEKFLRKTAMKGDFPYAASIATKKYSRSLLKQRTCQLFAVFLLNVQRERHLDLGWWTIIVTTKNAIWIWDTQKDALEKRRNSLQM